MEDNLFQRKKQYLYSFKPLEQRIRVLEKQIAALQDEMKRVKAISYGVHVSSGKKSDLSNNFVREENLIEQLMSVKRQKICKCAEICCQIELLEDENEKSVLQLHYIQGQSFERIAHDFKLSSRQIFNIQKAALKHFELPPGEEGG